MVPAESQENGQKEAKRIRREDFEEDDSQVEGGSITAHEEQMDTSLPAAVETQSPTLPSQDTESNTGNMVTAMGLKSIIITSLFDFYTVRINVIIKKV